MPLFSGFAGPLFGLHLDLLLVDAVAYASEWKNFVEITDIYEEIRAIRATMNDVNHAER